MIIFIDKLICLHPQDTGATVQERKPRKSAAAAGAEADAGASNEEQRRQRLLTYKDVCFFCCQPAAPDPRHPGEYRLSMVTCLYTKRF